MPESSPSARRYGAVGSALGVGLSTGNAPRSYGRPMSHVRAKMRRVTARRWWLVSGAYMAGLFALSSVPDDRTGAGAAILFPPPQVQNLLHVPVYGGLALVLAQALRARRHAPLLAAALATAYGALDEAHQMLVPGRFASVTDALLNALGAAAAAAWLTFRARR